MVLEPFNLNHVFKCILFLKILLEALECQLYYHDRFDHSEENKTISVDSKWVHYSKLNQYDATYNNWTENISNNDWSTVRNQLGHFNQTNDNEVIRKSFKEIFVC